MNSDGFGGRLIYERCLVIIWDFRIQSYAFVDSGFLFSLFGFGDGWSSHLVVIHPESNFKMLSTIFYSILPPVYFEAFWVSLSSDFYFLQHFLFSSVWATFSHSL